MREARLSTRSSVWCWPGILLAAGLASASEARAEPTITLKMPAFQSASFPNGSSIVVPEFGVAALEVWLQDALAEIQVSTVRVTLNQVPMATFLTTNRLPRGIRVVVRVGASINPDFSLRPGRENILAFSVSDASSVSYQAQFYVSLSSSATNPALAERAPVRPPLREVIAPAQVFPPTVVLKMDWPSKTQDRVLTLEAEVNDREGLRRVVLELNSKAIEEILLENEIPVRKQRGFIAKGKLPGSVTGDGRKILLSIPVTLNKRLNTVALRAENLSGLTGYADRTIELTTVR